MGLVRRTRSQWLGAGFSMAFFSLDSWDAFSSFIKMT